MSSNQTRCFRCVGDIHRSKQELENRFVEEALKKGARKIYATSRDVSNIPNFGDNRVVVLELDITNKHQIAKLKGTTIDVQIFVNNAGFLNKGTIRKEKSVE